MTKNWSFAKITEILLKKKFRSVIVFQNHYLNKILDVHPLQFDLLPTLKLFPNLTLKKYYKENIYLTKPKSCIRETLNLSTDVDSTTDTKTNKNGGLTKWRPHKNCI